MPAYWLFLPFFIIKKEAFSDCEDKLWLLKINNCALYKVLEVKFNTFNKNITEI